MRLLVNTDTVGGVWTYALELIRGLPAHEVEVVLATAGAPLRPAQRREVAALPVAALHESDFRLEWMQEPWEDVERAGRWLVELAEQERVDLIHLNDYSHAALEWPAPVLLVGHSGVAGWWNAIHGTDPPERWRRYMAAVDAGIAGADALVAPTRAMLRELQAHHGAGGGEVIANGSSAPAEPGAKRELVLAAGRLWDPAKNLATLDRAARALPWPVVAAGPLPEDERDLPRHVAATGELGRAKLAALRSQAAIFAAPARYEPFGLAALEAARAGCALVLGDIPSLREVWADAALFVDPEDDRALRAALERLIGDERLRHEMAQRASARSLRYTVEEMARLYAQQYRKLAATEAIAA